MGRKHRPAGLGSETSPGAPSIATPHIKGASDLEAEPPSIEAASAETTNVAGHDDWLRLAFDTSRDPLLLFDTRQRLIDCNRSACRVFSRGKDQLISHTLAELSDWLTVTSDGNFRLAPRGAAGDRQLVGAEAVASQTTSPWPSGDDASFTVADPLLRNVIESLPVGVWVIDLSGDVVVANSAGRQIWGGARNDWRRDGWWTAGGQKIAQDEWPGPRVLATNEAVEPTEAEVVTFEGARKTLLVSAAPIRNEHQQLLGAVCVHQDISTRVSAERAAQQELQRNIHLERLASIGTLAAGIAHEINNPLGTILLSAELGLASLAAENVDQRRTLTGIVADAKRCGRIVHNLLRFASRQATERSPGDLNNVVRSVRQRVAEYAWQHGVTLNIELTDQLPMVIMDAAAMEQAIINLIRNAVDASTEATGANVEIRTQALATAVRLTVRDYGPGINAQDLPRLFDPFYTTRRNLGSVGLGLSVAHGVVRDHDGALRIESTPGHGATIYLDLPTARDPAPARGDAP